MLGWTDDNTWRRQVPRPYHRLESPMRKLFREPLLHFLLIGAALFLLFNVVSGSKGGVDRQIVVNDATVAHIAQVYQSVWKRPVSPTELRGLVDSHVRDE